MKKSAFEAWLAARLSQDDRGGRPWVTLAYAQSLDGSITAQRGQPLAISSQESLQFTHRLRAMHDAILIGSGALLADNPRLTVRYVPGKSPQPVVLDSRLRCPTDAALFNNSHKPWLACLEPVNPDRQEALQAVGAQILPFKPDARGCVPLGDFLEALKLRGVSSLLVEGGAAVLTAFLQARLVDVVAITIAPRFVGGQPGILERLDVALRPSCFEQVGQDWLVWGELQ